MQCCQRTNQATTDPREMWLFFSCHDALVEGQVDLIHQKPCNAAICSSIAARDPVGSGQWTRGGQEQFPERSHQRKTAGTTLHSPWQGVAHQPFRCGQQVSSLGAGESGNKVLPSLQRKQLPGLVIMECLSMGRMDPRVTDHWRIIFPRNGSQAAHGKTNQSKAIFCSMLLAPLQCKRPHDTTAPSCVIAAKAPSVACICRMLVS